MEASLFLFIIKIKLNEVGSRLKFTHSSPQAYISQSSLNSLNNPLPKCPGLFAQFTVGFEPCPTAYCVLNTFKFRQRSILLSGRIWHFLGSFSEQFCYQVSSESQSLLAKGFVSFPSNISETNFPSFQGRIHKRVCEKERTSHHCHNLL